jgi:hypothetical protein
MKTISRFGCVLGLTAILTLGACATRSTANPAIAGATKFYSGIGVVQSIQIVRQEGDSVAPIDRSAEDISRQDAGAYKFSVHMDDNSDKTIVQNTDGGFAVGDCVQVQNKILQRCGHKLGE